MNLEEKNKPQNSLLIEKAERLTEAFYRVTELFPDEEPIKWTLRKKAVEILDRALRLEREPFHSQTEDLKALSGFILDIVSLLKLSSSGAFISRVNFEVLAREYANLLDFLNSDQGHITLKIQETILLDKKPLVEKNIDNSKAQTALSKTMSKTLSKTMSETNKMSEIMSERTAKIIDFFKKNGNQWLNIIDLEKALKSKDEKVSSKTICRNLDILIKKGMIIHQGANRWRKYALRSENA